MGIFALANGLAQDGRLSPAEHIEWRAGNDWYEAAFTDPTTVDPSIYDRAINPTATAWFKVSATHLTDRLQRYLDILQTHGVACVRVESVNPGRIIYEDTDQVVVVTDTAQVVD
ncbi:hypothetical protein [Nocardioides aurantiacus]|uniref:hypothetical protein n=1 Tax=Nocardioides aurantiacus TaxID=86796 RepID=UPI001B86D9F2|nr:hypothetical protein [Nocardioides aurantiacus]